MVEIGGKPMLWHIMNIYAAYGYKEFVVALGYKGEIIRIIFSINMHHTRNLTVNLNNGKGDRSWRKWPGLIVHLLDTGTDTQTGGRINV